MDQGPGTPHQGPIPPPMPWGTGSDTPYRPVPPVGGEPPGNQPPLPPLFPGQAHFPPPPPPPPPPRSAAGRRLGRAALVVGAAAGVAIGATALASAATSGPDVHAATATASGSSGSSPSTPAPEPDFHGFGRFGGSFGGPGGPFLYGQFTVKGPNGYETLAVRTGTVSDITNTSGSTWSLTVKSDDGTTGTFVVDTGTSVNGGETGISSVKQNDTVRVLALVNGTTSTAKQVTDETVLGANGNSWAPKPPAPPSTPGSSQSQTGASLQ